MEALLNADQVATMIGLHISRRTVLRAAKAGELAYVAIGRGFGFRESDVEAWIESRRSVPTLTGPRIDATLSPRSAARRSRSAS